MSDIGLTQVGRIVIRPEGNMWNAYFAMPATMENAAFLGAVSLKAAQDHPRVHAAFITAMRTVVECAFLAANVTEPTWMDMQPAPDHERAGHG